MALFLLKASAKKSMPRRLNFFKLGIDTVNIILIGIMGAGKTTVGKLLSRKLGYRFIDMDDYIEESQGETITQMFERGEDYFRKIEAGAVQSLGKLEQVVIATGGGIVKNDNNMKVLSQGGVIVYLQRQVDKILEVLDVSGRPLLRDNPQRLHEILREREELYNRYGEIVVQNNGDAGQAAQAIITALEDRGIRV